MAEASKNQVLPRQMTWNGQQVEVIRTGHFPTTVMVRLQDHGKEIEVELEDLRV